MNASAPSRPRIATRDDIRALEAVPYEASVPAAHMYDLFLRSAAQWGARTAITWMENGHPDTPARTLTYADLLTGITQAANMFRDLGVGEDDSVALLLPNMPSAHMALWGAETAGRACPINNLLSPDHLAHLVEASGAKVLVALGPDPDLGIWERARDLRKRCPGLEALLVVDGPDDSANDIHNFEDLLSRYQGDALNFDRDLGRDSPAACFHTGGTTGAPKLAQHTHGNQVHTSWSASVMYDLSPEDVLINGFPLFHVAGSFVFGSAAFIAGAGLLLPTRSGMRNPDVVANYWHHVDRFGVSFLACVPTVMAALMNVSADGADLSRVRAAITGGTMLPSELATAFEKKFDLPVRNVFGMTESAGLVSIAPLHGTRSPGGCGLPLPYTEVRAVPLTAAGPDLERTCTPGESGVVCLRGPHVGPGYTDPVRNAGMFAENGWLISGDLGHVDGDGQIFLTGRSKDVIIRGAHNIDPAMIEETVDQHPAVEMSAAVGQPDGYAGELPVLFVTLKPGEETSERELLEFLTTRIAERPALPKRITVVDSMPVTAIGKIYKPTLRLRAIERAYAEQLADLVQTENLTVRVEGVDEGGILSARLHISGGDDCKGAEAAIATRLRDFAVPWSCVWE